MQEIDYTVISAPMSSGSIMMDRPLSSAASHSNSAHTNTSELSSGGDSSSSNSSQKIIVPTDSSSSSNSTAVIMPEISQHGSIMMSPRLSSQQNRVRLADGIIRSASPQSPFSARLSGKNQNKPANSSSVYYYSDTLKKPLPPLSSEENSFDTDNKVNTKVTLIEEKDTGSTLV